MKQPCPKTFKGLHNRTLTADDLGLLPGQSAFFDSCCDLRLAPVSIAGGHVELLSCARIHFDGWRVDAQGKHLRAFYLDHCSNIEAFGCLAENARGYECHNFQANGGYANLFERCISKSKKWRQEDHFSFVDEVASRWVECRATGPITRTGTAFCFDAGSSGCLAYKCYARVKGPGEARTVTVSEANSSRIDSCDFGNGIVGVDSGVVTIIEAPPRRLWIAEGVLVTIDGVPFVGQGDWWKGTT